MQNGSNMCRRDGEKENQYICNKSYLDVSITTYTSHQINQYMH